jgi:RNA polymerase sigma-70 factor (ECF subfamily)
MTAAMEHEPVENGEVAWLRAVVAGDRAAARRLVDEVGPVVYGYVFVRVGGDASAAEDIVQDVFLESTRSADSFRGESALSTWMCTIARRRVARFYEQERRHAETERHLATVPEGEPGAGLPGVEDRDAVARALGELPVLHRQVLVLKYLDDLSVAEIAEELGRTRVQVQSLLQRARSAMRHRLDVEAWA